PPKKKPDGLSDKKLDALPAPRVVSSPPLGAPAGPCLDGAACTAAPHCCNADGCGHFGLDECCARPDHCFWISGEYLLWWVKGQKLPPLVTLGNPADDVPGAIGQPGTVLLFGGRQNDDARSGGRVRLGWWFDEEHTVGIDGSFFALSQENKTFTAGSPGSPAIFRPFLNAGSTFVPGTGFVATAPFEDAEAVAFPGALAGSVIVRQTSRLWGYDANLRTSLWDGSCHGVCWNVDGYAGFRSLRLDESLEVGESLTSLFPGAAGNIGVFDKFKTQNTFYGGQIGLETELRWRRWFLDVNSRVAVGDMHETADLVGLTTTSDATGTHTAAGGLLVQGTNMGSYSRDRIAVVPELGLNVGYQVTDGLRLFVGYNLLYVSNVARPGDQIDRTVNITQIPRLGGGPLVGPARPGFAFQGSDFYAQGLNLGVEFRW
ncbi:MAG TPA: BBP7 family outer membrane beta-barrel protein, partial [Gemmataceae bacterium]|nr:BBP7 family outer membrane beta-barrel protein [Gemmataceae bacterium]